MSSQNFPCFSLCPLPPVTLLQTSKKYLPVLLYILPLDKGGPKIPLIAQIFINSCIAITATALKFFILYL